MQNSPLTWQRACDSSSVILANCKGQNSSFILEELGRHQLCPVRHGNVSRAGTWKCRDPQTEGTEAKRGTVCLWLTPQLRTLVLSVDTADRSKLGDSCRVPKVKGKTGVFDDQGEIAAGCSVRPWNGKKT